MEKSIWYLLNHPLDLQRIQTALSMQPFPPSLAFPFPIKDLPPCSDIFFTHLLMVTVYCAAALQLCNKHTLIVTTPGTI